MFNIEFEIINDLSVDMITMCYYLTTNQQFRIIITKLVIHVVNLTSENLLYLIKINNDSIKAI